MLPPDALALTSASVLAGVAGLHVLWGFGSAWPATDHARLADAVAGTQPMPPAAACFGAAGALVVAAGLVAGAGGQRRPVRLARAGVATGLLIRGVMGVTGRTRLLVPWTPTASFRNLDRWRYGPLCLALGLSIWASRSGAR